MEKRQASEDEKHKDPKATMEEWEPSPLPPIAPDGGFAPDMVGNPEPIPEWTPENSICLRGPCTHYWHLVTMSEAGNPKGTWEALGVSEPRQHNHTCLVHPGLETDLTENNVYGCSKWAPMSIGDRERCKAVREAYFAEHPEHRAEEENGDKGISGIEGGGNGRQGQGHQG